MKETSKDGRIWFEKKGTEVQIGFTSNLLSELEDCWHLLPAASNKTEIKENQPLLSVETNDGLFSVPTPVSGIITFFDNKAMNFPQKLTTDDVVCVVTDAEEIKKKKQNDEDALRQLLQENNRRIEAEAQRLAQQAAADPAHQEGLVLGGAVRPNQIRPRLFNDFFEQPQPAPQAVVQAPRNIRGRR